MTRKILKLIVLCFAVIAVIVSAGLLSLKYFVVPAIEKKVREAAADNLGSRAEISQVNIKLPEAVILVKGFKIADSTSEKYGYSAGVDEATLRIDLISTFLQKRLILDEVSVKDAALVLEKKSPQASPDTPLPDAPTNSAPPATRPPQGNTGKGRFSELYIRKVKVEDMKFIFNDYSAPHPPAVIEVVSINGEINNFLMSFRAAGNFKAVVDFKGYFDPARKGLLKANGIVAKRGDEVDFDLKSEISGADLTYFSQYYANTSFTILKEAEVDIVSDAKCRKNELETYHDARIYGIRLNDVTPTYQDTLFGLPAATVVNFFNDYGGEVKFSFNIGGTLSDPRFEPSPVIKEVMSKALGDKIAARLRELPREVVKISEKAIKGDIDLGKESQVWIKGVEKQFEAFKRELKEKYDSNKTVH